MSKIEKALDNIVSNKYERTEDCVEALHNKEHKGEIIKLCFSSNGQEVVSYDQIKDFKIGRIDAIKENYFDYCLAELGNVGIDQCKNVPAYKTIIEGPAADLKDAVADAVHTLVGDNSATEHTGL